MGLIKLIFSCQWASNSVYYLLGLWSRLVSSVPYLKGDAPSLLDEFVPKITENFITSRFNSVQVFPTIHARFTCCLLHSYMLYTFNFKRLLIRHLHKCNIFCLFLIGWIAWWSFWEPLRQCRTSSGSIRLLPIPM